MNPEPPEEPPLVLPEVMDYVAAPKLLCGLKARRGKSLTLDAAQVRFVGALSAQVLRAAQIDWRDNGLEFRILSSNEAFEDGLRVLGLWDDFFGEGVCE